MNIFKKESTILLILAAACLFFFFFNLGGYKLIDVDEPRYAEAAREMIESRDWITPYFNYELRFDKPVFFYWLIALSYLAFGVTEFAARFPSALLASGLVFLTYYFGRTTISKAFGLISSLILVTSLEFIAMARMSITDMTLAFFICASIFAAMLAIFAKDSSKKYWWWLAYLASGLAVLTKGPVGFVLPAAIIGLNLILTGKLKESLNPKFIIPGFAIFALAVIPWYWAIISIHGNAFVEYFFIKHNVARFADSGFKQHAQPFYFYFIVLFAGFFPWITYLIASLIKYVPQLYKTALEKKDNLKKFNFALFSDADNKIKVLLINLVWFVGVFLFYSSSRAKLLTYILPFFPPIAMLTGMLWHEYLVENKAKKSVKVSAKVFAILCFIMAFVALFAMNFILPRDEKIVIDYSNYILGAAFIVIPAAMLIYLWKNDAKRAFILKILFMAIVTVNVIYSILPAIYNSGQKELVEFVNYSKSVDSGNYSLNTYKLIKPSVIFYAQQKVPNIREAEELTQYFAKKEKSFIITRNRHVNDFNNSEYVLVKQGHRYSLLANIK